MRSFACGAVLSLIWLGAATPVRANPMEVLGMTSRHAAQANAGVASVDDAAALYYDPAGLVANPHLELSVGTLGAYSRLRIGSDREKLASPYGVQVAMRAPLPLAGSLRGRIVVGIAFHIVPLVARVIAPGPDQPAYPYFDRLSRLVVLPGAAIALGHGLALGVAANILGGLAGGLSASEGITREIDARVDERVPTVARVIAGVSWQLAPAWRVAAVYRQRFEVPFRTDAKTIVGGEPIDLDLRASGLFTPHQITAGAAWRAEPDQLPVPLTVSLDLGWAKWSDYPGPYVQVESRLPLVGSIPGRPPRLAYDDTFAARLGLETHRTDGGPIARAGYAFETSAIPESQPGVSNLLDGNHHTIGLGGGWQWPSAWSGRGLRLDAHLQLQLVGSRTITKQVTSGKDYDPATSLRDEDPDTAGVQITNPGFPTLSSGGQVISAGLTLAVGL